MESNANYVDCKRNSKPISYANLVWIAANIKYNFPEREEDKSNYELKEKKRKSKKIKLLDRKNKNKKMYSMKW